MELVFHPVASFSYWPHMLVCLQASFCANLVYKCVNWHQQEGDPGKKNRANEINGYIKYPDCILSVGDTNKLGRKHGPHM